MDSSGEDGEYQVEAVITPQSKEGKQGRLLFLTLSPDSPKINEKRKSVTSLDCRTAKYPKVSAEENSFEKSEKDKTEDIVAIVEEKEENNDSTTVKDTSELEEKTDTDSLKNKKTPGRGSGKHTKSESKVSVNPLTKFSKKIDSKDSKSEAQSPSSENNEEETEKSLETESKEASVTENVEGGCENEDVTEIKKDEEHHSDSEENVVESHETSSSSKENESDNGDVDSDLNSDLDYSHDNDNDSHKSDTDCKKTEHEDTDSKDDTSSGESTRHITPAKKKRLDFKGEERKLTPKQLEKKQEIQKKREMRDKQRQEREDNLQEERESKKREKEVKQLEQEESSGGNASNYSKKTGTLKKFRQQIFGKGGLKKCMKSNLTASTSNLVLNETKPDGCQEIVDDVVVIKFDVSGDWELLSRALKFGSNTLTPLIILFKTNLSSRVSEFRKYCTRDGEAYKVFYCNENNHNSSEIILLANKNVNLKVTYLSSDSSNLPLLNHFMAVKVKLDKYTKFNLIAVDICLQRKKTKKVHAHIQKFINAPTMIFINCDEEQTPDCVVKTTDPFELQKKIVYRDLRNSMINSFFYMSKTQPVGLERINIAAPSLESPTCMVIRREKESE